jgi:DNA-nicking Smr family endonuclease
MRSRRAEREQQFERNRARDRKGRSADRGGLQDVAAAIPSSAFVTLDLHGDTREEARKRIPDAVKDAKGKGLKVVRVIHGFNRGSVLSAETQKVLFRLKQQGLVAAFAVNGANPGETIVQLA